MNIAQEYCTRRKIGIIPIPGLHTLHRPCLSAPHNRIVQTTMPEKAGGSLIVVDGKVVGSELIGQNFSRLATSRDALQQ